MAHPLAALEEQRAEVLQILDAAAGAPEGVHFDDPASKPAGN